MQNKKQLAIENQIKRIELQLSLLNKEVVIFITKRDNIYDKMNKAYEKESQKLEKEYDAFDRKVAKLQIKQSDLYKKLNPTISPKYTPEEIENARKVLNDCGFKIVKVVKR